MTRSLSLVFITLIFSLYSHALLADTIWMKNGDKLTGKVTLLTNGKLVLKTDYASNITIMWSKVSTLSIDEERLVVLQNNSQHNIRTLSAAKENHVIVSGAKKQTIPLKKISQIITPKPILRDSLWSGNINIAFDSKKSDKNTNDLNVDFQTKFQYDQWRHLISGEYVHKTSNDKTSSHNYELNYALDRLLNEKWFWKNTAEYAVDHVEDLYKQYQIGTGPGYQFWNNSLGSFSLASLMNLSRYEYRHKSNKTFNALGIRWDYNRYLLGKNFELFSEGELTRPLNNTVARYTIDASAGLRYRLTDWSSLNIKFSRKFVDADSDAGLNETRYIIGFGINW